MKKSLFILALVVCLLLTSCTFPTPGSSSSTAASTTKPVPTDTFLTDLKAAIENAPESSNFTVASACLQQFFGINHFNYSKVAATEDLYSKYFVGDIPPALEVAKSMAQWVVEGIEQGVLDHTDYEEMTDFLLSAYLVSVGDKYATYLNKENFESYMSSTSGNFVGIGVLASYNQEQNSIEIISVIADSPAEAAGILAGDQITKVDDCSVAEEGYYTAIARMRGEVGSTVTVTVKRGESTFELTIPRAELTEQTVYHKMLVREGKKVGYVMITTFSEVTFDQFKAAVDELQENGATYIIFDMRNNGGGLLTAVLSMLDYLLPDGKPLANYVYYDGSTEYDVGKDGHHVNLPFAIIVNEYTASAAELFTSALQDYAKRGFIAHTEVIGTVTYGKGTMQRLFTYTDDTALTVSIAYYQPPYSPNYEGIGVIPDVEVTLPEIHQSKNPQLIPEGEDTQLEAALSFPNIGEGNE